jgi:L-alanine-DL-glutamate epimerase-like enolase superfamily enzyme
MIRTLSIWLLAFVALTPADVELFRDDFSRFPPGLLSAPVGQLNGAIQEYHYLPHRGVPTAPWYNPITHNDSWVAGDEDGKTYLEQHLIHDQPERWQPLFVTGDPLWTSYTVTARVRPLSLAESAGLVFRYHTNHHYYAFTISGGKRARLALKSPFENKFRTVEWKELGKGAGSRGLDRLAAVTQAIKGRAQLLLDSLGAFKLHEAEQLGRELDQMPGIGWWEDALMPEDTTGYPRLAAALSTPICVGEGLSNRFQFRDLFATKACDIINPDVCRAGGITECKRIATLADAHGVLWSPHVSTGTAPYVAASLHLAVATANFVIIEGGNKSEGPLGNVLLKEPLEFKPGSARVPERPGLGVEFDEKELAKVIV